LIWKDYDDDWELISVYIDETEAPLGLVVCRDVFPMTKSSSIENETKSKPNNDTISSRSLNCRVLRINPISLAEKYGIRPGDWICMPNGPAGSTGGDDDDNDDDSRGPIQASFKYITSRAVDRSEAFRLQLVRRRPETVVVDDEAEASPKAAKEHQLVSHGGSLDDGGQSLESEVVNQEQPPIKTILISPSKAVKRRRQQGGAEKPVVHSSPNKQHQRKTKKSIDSTSKVQSNSSPSQPNPSIDTASNTASDRRLRPSKKTSTMTTNATTSQKILTAPSFCKLCHPPSKDDVPTDRKKKQKQNHDPRVHHAWCPRNPDFDDSGSDDILKRVMEGKEIG